MLGPDSRLLIALLVTASVALLVAVVRFRLLPVRVLCGALSVTVAMTGGVAAVNYYYGYYTTWTALWADFHGGGAGNLGAISTSTPTTRTSATGTSTAGTSTTTTVLESRIGWISLPGKRSGYSRRALLYLPPQYSEARYAGTRFPVVELFHGTPGSPTSWDAVLQISQVADSLIARHVIGPMVLVMPSINGSGRDYQDCVNGPGVSDDTYLTQDVRADVLARYRVSHDPYEWGVSGYSSGGYCAANLALRHRGSFGAAAVIEGYLRAADGPAATALKHSQPLETANSPLYLAERLAPGSGPVPAFWVAAGTRDTTDYLTATRFAAALNRIEPVPFIKLNAADSGNAWQAVLPAALTWLWQQLAPPDLRVLFPVRARAPGVITLPVRPIKPHHHGKQHHGKPPPGHARSAPAKKTVRVLRNPSGGAAQVSPGRRPSLPPWPARTADRCHC
jgi:poly(3-hydroxybutyrate) depolymerase